MGLLGFGGWVSGGRGGAGRFGGRAQVGSVPSRSVPRPGARGDGLADGMVRVDVGWALKLTQAQGPNRMDWAGLGPNQGMHGKGNGCSDLGRDGYGLPSTSTYVPDRCCRCTWRRPDNWLDPVLGRVRCFMRRAFACQQHMFVLVQVQSVGSEVVVRGGSQIITG